ncbi:IS110 family transposase [Nocardia sp. NBC_00416]|uniref:IS110 family transposase n=1 Tax=Nocardia sp. NBC_00416 TaxID=2975991 RepID=UPI002E1D6242
MSINSAGRSVHYVSRSTAPAIGSCADSPKPGPTRSGRSKELVGSERPWRRSWPSTVSKLSMFQPNLPTGSVLSTGHGRKTDALSVGIAALNSTGLQSMRTDPTAQVLRTLTEYRDDLIRTRTQTANRLHRLLVQLVPAGLPKRLTAEAAAQLLRSVRPREHYGRALRQVAVDLVAELRRLDRRIDSATDSLNAVVTESRTQLTTIHGVGTVVAAKILAHTGDIRRFRSAAAFASYAGVAPIEVSSGDARRHRLSRAGDRQLNYALHVIAITQIRRDTVGRAYYQRKRAAGKGHKEALRCLKRQLSDIVYRIMLRDAGTSLLAGA